jgi:hypothetical protein
MFELLTHPPCLESIIGPVAYFDNSILPQSYCLGFADPLGLSSAASKLVVTTAPGLMLRAWFGSTIGGHHAKNNSTGGTQ